MNALREMAHSRPTEHMVIRFEDQAEWSQAWREPDYRPATCAVCSKAMDFPMVWVVPAYCPGDYLVHPQCVSTACTPRPIAKLLTDESWILCVKPQNDQYFQWNELRHLVGEFAGIVKPDSNHGVVLVVNKLMEQYDDLLFENELASQVAGESIYGTALLCHVSQLPVL